MSKGFLDEVEFVVGFKYWAEREGHSTRKENHEQRPSGKQGLALTYKRKQGRSGH